MLKLQGESLVFLGVDVKLLWVWACLWALGCGGKQSCFLEVAGCFLSCWHVEAQRLCITCPERKKNINFHYAKVITKSVQKDEQRLLFKPREPEPCLHLFRPLFLQCWKRSESKREDMSAGRKLLVSNDVYTLLRLALGNGLAAASGVFSHLWSYKYILPEYSSGMKCLSRHNPLFSVPQLSSSVCSKGYKCTGATSQRSYIFSSSGSS